MITNTSSVVGISSGRPRYPLVGMNSAVKSLNCASGATVTIGTGVVLTILQ